MYLEPSFPSSSQFILSDVGGEIYYLVVYVEIIVVIDSCTCATCSVDGQPIASVFVIF